MAPAPAIRRHGVGDALRVGVFALAALIAVFVEAAPIGTGPDARPSPDLAFCVIAFFVLRWPEIAPAVVVFALALMRDLITDVPVGAGALSAVLAAEILRLRRRALMRQPFVSEWITVAALAFAALALQWLMVTASFAHPPAPTLLAQQLTATVAVYPAVVLVFRWILRVKWSPAPPARPEGGAP